MNRRLLIVLCIPLVAATVLTCGETAGPDTTITSLTLTPSLDTITALGATVTVTVHASIGSQGTGGGSYTWELTDTTVARLLPPAGSNSVRMIQGWKNGSTVLHVREAGGARDSARIVVHQRVSSILAPQETATLRGCPARIFAFAVDALNNNVPGAVLTWASTDTTLARVDSSGLVTPLAAGVDSIAISSGNVTRRVAVVIRVAPTPTFHGSGAFAPVTTVGVGQYALGFGELGTSIILGSSARFRVVSSDTTILRPTPADTEAFQFSTTVTAGPVRLVGRAVGDVMLTPYMCDVAGASVPFRVTRARLKLLGSPPDTARTDDPPMGLSILTQDSTGAFQFTAVPLTVRIISTDPNAIRPDSAYRHLPVGTTQVSQNFTFPDTGTARIVLIDSSGVFLSDSSSAVQVVYPPLFVFSNSGVATDTLHVGLRQKPFYDVYRARVGLDRFVSGTPLRVTMSTSDSAIVRVAQDSLDIPLGESATTAGFDIAARDTRGTAIITAHAHRHTNDHSVIVVGRPAAQVSAPAGFVNYPGDPDRAVQVFTADSATGAAGFPTEDVTFSLTVSDTTVLSLDSATLTVPAGSPMSGLAGITLKKPGSATITATDPRVGPHAYFGATSAPVVIDEPSLAVDSVLTMGIDQRFGLGVVVNGRLQPGDVIHAVNRNPAVATLADTIVPQYIPGFHSVLANGVAAGVDTVIVTAPGFRPDTGTIVVGAGTIELAQWPLFGLQVNQTWPLELKVFAPNGEARLTAVSTTFALTANGNIEFFKDGVPVTSLTLDAGEHFMQVTVKGKAAGTGTVTVSAPNYTPLMLSVTISP